MEYTAPSPRLRVTVKLDFLPQPKLRLPALNICMVSPPSQTLPLAEEFRREGAYHLRIYRFLCRILQSDQFPNDAAGKQ